MATVYSSIYALKAFECVTSVSHNLKGDYEIVAFKIPTMLFKNGLTQTVGYLLAKSKDDDAVGQYCKDLMTVMSYHSNEEFKGFHNNILKCSIAEYGLYTQQAIQAVSFIKRYVQACFDVPKTEAKQHD